LLANEITAVANPVPTSVYTQIDGPGPSAAECDKKQDCSYDDIAGPDFFSSDIGMQKGHKPA
jgi:hypothetical protein